MCNVENCFFPPLRLATLTSLCHLTNYKTDFFFQAEISPFVTRMECQVFRMTRFTTERGEEWAEVIQFTLIPLCCTGVYFLSHNFISRVQKPPALLALSHHSHLPSPKNQSQSNCTHRWQDCISFLKNMRREQESPHRILFVVQQAVVIYH